MKILSCILLAFAVLTDAAILFLIVLRYPCNHGAVPSPLFLMLISLLAVPAVWRRHRAALVAFLLCLLGLFMLWTADYLNIMLEYETWIHRGMPAWGEWR